MLQTQQQMKKLPTRCSKGSVGCGFELDYFYRRTRVGANFHKSGRGLFNIGLWPSAGEGVFPCIWVVKHQHRNRFLAISYGLNEQTTHPFNRLNKIAQLGKKQAVYLKEWKWLHMHRNVEILWEGHVQWRVLVHMCKIWSPICMPLQAN